MVDGCRLKAHFGVVKAKTIHQWERLGSFTGKIPGSLAVPSQGRRVDMVRYEMAFGTTRTFEGTTIRCREDGRVFILISPEKMREVPRRDRGFIREGQTAIRFEKRCLLSKTVAIKIRTLSPPKTKLAELGEVPRREFRRDPRIRRLNS